MTHERRILAERIKRYRREQKINQYEFAEDCGISRTLLSLIEAGKENVTLDTLQLLIAKMGIPMSELFSRRDAFYFVFPSKVEVDGVEHITYGIGALRNDVMVDCVPDISSNFNMIKNLVKLCNDRGLSLSHLRDIAEDAIVDID